MTRIRFRPELIVSAAILVLLTLIWNPFGFFEPGSRATMVIVVIFAAVSFFVSLLWGENARDERERFHRMISDRTGFLTGILVLLVLVLRDAAENTLSLKLIFTLGVMGMAKIIALIYSQSRR